MCCNVTALLTLSGDVQSVLVSSDSKLFSFTRPMVKNLLNKKNIWRCLAASCSRNNIGRSILHSELTSPACFRPLPHAKVLEKLCKKELHGLESWHFLTWSQISCRSVQYEFPDYRALCHPSPSSLSCSNIHLSTSLMVLGWEEFARASSVSQLCGMKSPFVIL